MKWDINTDTLSNGRFSGLRNTLVLGLKPMTIGATSSELVLAFQEGQGGAGSLGDSSLMQL
jgi:hypothetical protein